MKKDSFVVKVQIPEISVSIITSTVTVYDDIIRRAELLHISLQDFLLVLESKDETDKQIHQIRFALNKMYINNNSNHNTK